VPPVGSFDGLGTQQTSGIPAGGLLLGGRPRQAAPFGRLSRLPDNRRCARPSALVLVARDGGQV
jgi:hypothetical protein